MDEQLNRMAGPYLAYIHLYMRLRRRPQPKPTCSNIFA
jgi:hypothetical protein